MAHLEQLGIHPATMRHVSNLDARARTMSEAGFRAWGLRGVEIEEFLAGGKTVKPLGSSPHGTASSCPTRALNDWQWTGHPPLVNRRPDPSAHRARDLWRRVEVFFDRCAGLGARIIVALGPNRRDGRSRGTVPGHL